MRFTFFLSFLFISCLVSAQLPQPTSFQTLEERVVKRDLYEENSIYNNVTFKNIGPSIMSGRVVDIAVNPDDPTQFLVAYASGGLFYTVNNGTSFTPLMDNAPTINIGDIAASWTTQTIWVGTGENNSSRSSYAGIGVLKSTDWGKTWSEPMLMDTQHIGRILINPLDENHIVVAATGALYSTGSSGGIYTTTDGGTNWNKNLTGEENSGFIDLAATPGDFNTLYASSWDKYREAWNFRGSGTGSAIYKSTDGGNNWSKVSTASSGFPTGDGAGRIGLAVYDHNTLYAIHDSQFRRDKDDDDSSEDYSKQGRSTKAESKKNLQKDDFKTMSREQFLALEDKKLDSFLKTNGFQEKYRAANVKNIIRSGKALPIDVAKYLENSNSQLFDTPVKGAELYRSDDAGKSWYKTHDGQIDDLFYSYGYYFAQVRVHPRDMNKVYVMGVPIVKSDNGGKNWSSISKENVHADHHALWINPDKNGHLINGNDGGINISYDDGTTWIKNNSPTVGQFYAINYDLEEPYNIYGGLQDNGVWVGAHNAVENRAWQQSGKYPWTSIMGGDGMHIQIDNRNSNLVYTGYQFGNYYRINRATGERTYIQPKHNLGESPYRFNWQTPILLSKHNQDILYLGGNKLMRSMNNGDDWTAISPDLTLGGKKGNVAYGTITTISESASEFGKILVGTDDGLLQLTTDSGSSWQNLEGNWSKNLWVSRAVISKHDANTFYVTLNGYRYDDFTAYVYKTTDNGKNWMNIGTQLPAHPINVIVEHPQDKNLLFLGTDNAVFASIDQGKNWSLFNSSMPPVAVHDLKIQPQSNDLLLGTHGRSIYKCNLDMMHLVGDNFAFAKAESIKNATQYGNKRYTWGDVYLPQVNLSYYVPKSEKINMSVKSKENKTLYNTTLSASRGINFYTYNAQLSESGRKKLPKSIRPDQAQNGNYYLPKGEYFIELTARGKSITRELVIE